MRTTFFANKKRIKEQANNGKVFNVKWIHFESLSFLSRPQDNDSEDVSSIIKSQDGDHSMNSEAEITQDVNLPSQDAFVVSEIPIPKSNVWSISDEESLISFYHSHRSLWDHRDMDYKKSQRGQIMDDLAEHLELKFTSM